VVISVNTVAFLTLPDHLRTYASSFQTLLRNIGASFGISLVIAQLTDTTTRMHAHLAEFINPFNDALKAPDVASILNTATDAGRAMLDLLLTQQAMIIAYANDFKLLMLLTAATIPLVFFIGTSRARTAPSAEQAAHALE